MQELDAKHALPVLLQPRNQSPCSLSRAPRPQMANDLILYPEISLPSGFEKVVIAKRSISASYQCEKFLDLIGVSISVASVHMHKKSNRR